MLLMLIPLLHWLINCNRLTWEKNPNNFHITTKLPLFRNKDLINVWKMNWNFRNNFRTDLTLKSIMLSAVWIHQRYYSSCVIFEWRSISVLCLFCVNYLVGYAESVFILDSSRLCIQNTSFAYINGNSPSICIMIDKISTNRFLWHIWVFVHCIIVFRCYNTLISFGQGQGWHREPWLTWNYWINLTDIRYDGISKCSATPAPISTLDLILIREKHWRNWTFWIVASFVNAYETRSYCFFVSLSFHSRFVIFVFIKVWRHFVKKW